MSEVKGRDYITVFFLLVFIVLAVLLFLRTAVIHEVPRNYHSWPIYVVTVAFIPLLAFIVILPPLLAIRYILEQREKK